MKKIVVLAILVLVGFVSNGLAFESCCDNCTTVKCEVISKDHRFYSSRLDLIKSPERVEEIRQIRGVDKVHDPERYRISVVKGSSFQWNEIHRQIVSILSDASTNRPEFSQRKKTEL